MTGKKFRLLLKLLGISSLLLLLGYFAEWDLAALIGLAGTVIFGAVFLFVVLPIRLQGQKWWRQM